MRRTKRITTKQAKSKSLGEYKSSRRVRPSTLSEAKQQLQVNAEGYVASMLDPFNVTGMRLPDPSPFPSTVGTSVMRHSFTGIDDAATAPATDTQVLGAVFHAGVSTGSAWVGYISAYDTEETKPETWSYVVHPHITPFTTNFQLMRTVSMGIRVINVGPLIERGGAIMVAHSTAFPEYGGFNNNLLEQLKTSSELVVFDAATMREKGLSTVYIPLSYLPVSAGTGAGGAGKMYPTGSCYVNPLQDWGATSPLFMDTNIYVFVVGSKSETLDIVIEQVHNWEAIPYPYTEYMFARKAVAGSEETRTAAIAARVGSNATRSTVSDGKEFSSVYGALKNVALSGVESLGKSLIPRAIEQVGGLAMRALGMLPGLLLADYKRHVVAVNLGLYSLSPLANPELRTLSDSEFAKVCALRLEKKDAPEKKRKE